jgi:tetratricopeptide (TPR) repeat protein
MNSQTDPATDQLLKDAMQAHRAGELATAAECYDRFLAANSRHARALRLRGSLARELGDLPLSLGLLERARDCAPDDAEPLNELALTLMAGGRLEEAQAVLRRSLELAPDSRRALANLGALAQYRGHVGPAIDYAQRYLALQPDDLEVRCNLATALVDAGRGEEARVACETALAQAPGHPFVLATQGAVLVALEDYANALPVLELAAGRNPDNDLALINLACAQHGVGQVAEARHTLERALRVNPDNARAASDLALLLADAGKADAALAVSESFLDRHRGERLVLAAHAQALLAAGREPEGLQLLDADVLVDFIDIDTPPGYAGLEAFNQTLAELILGNDSLLAEPVSKSTRGGRQTGELDLQSDPALQTLEVLLRTQVEAYTRRRIDAGLSDHPVMAYAAERYGLRVWGTVLAAGGRQASHLHPLGFVSGVYYLALPERMNTAGPQAGWLEFGTPPPRFPDLPCGPLHRIAPRPGRLLLFPSYFRHATLPFEADEPRISLAFDAMPQR